MSAPRDKAGFARELESVLRSCPREDRSVLFVGVLNAHMPRGKRAVLVGGALVEFYTAGQYTTADIDVVGEADPIVELLEAAGFEKSGRVRVSEALELVVDVAGRSLRRSETVVYLELEGYSIPMVSVEDAIVDRLLAAKFWKSRTDREQARLLYETQRKRIDGKELARKARENEVDDVLAVLLGVAAGRR